jgi:Na+-translocating ferredoxin:NAD+ oxidoreductase RnfG subunit
MTDKLLYRIIKTVGLALFIFALLMLLLFRFQNSDNLPTGIRQLADEMLLPTQTVVTMQKQYQGKNIEYFEVQSLFGKTNGFIFSSKDFAPEIIGYNDAITILIYTDKNGIHKDFRIEKEYETPEYLAQVMKSKNIFLNQNLFTASPEENLEMVTGATISSNAISKTIRKSGNIFASEILGINKPTLSAVNQKTKTASPLPLILFYTILVTAIAIRYRPSASLRYTFLALTLLLLGVLYNIQFSSDNFVTLLKFSIPEFSTTAFALAVIIPLLILIFGNFYCGYLCPVGALQELLNLLTPKKIVKLTPSYTLMKILSTFKYIILFILIIEGVVLNHTQLFYADMVRGVFSGVFKNYFFLVILPAIGFSFFFKRYWCRIFCPTGAFLSILNSAKFARKILPKTKPGKCDIGIKNHKELDCINCDYCRLKSTDFYTKKRSDKTVSNTDLLLIACTVYMITVLLIYTIH